MSSYTEEGKKNVEVNQDIIFTLKDSSIKIKLILPKKLNIFPKINNRKIELESLKIAQELGVDASIIKTKLKQIYEY